MIPNNPYTSSYISLFNMMVINPGSTPVINTIVNKITAGKAQYKEVEAITGVPWFFIGVIHSMEANNDFTRHLHNGDSLKAKTVNVPKGRPIGVPPFTWKASAVDALKYMGYDKVTDWTVPNMLYLFEKYNGFGYRKKGIYSPYLWSFSNLYTKGKYTADGKYDPNAVSRQVGAGVILKTVMQKHQLITAAIAAGGSFVTMALITLAFFF